MSEKQCSQQQKYQHKLAKSQRKLGFYLSLTTMDSIKHKVSIRKRLAKIEKYQLKILKYQAKLASNINTVKQPTIAYTKLHSANDNGAFTSLRLIDKLSLNRTQILHRPFKASPCKSCPALRGKTCLCALKQQQRLQAL
ncbi:hypothetical protein JK628_14630 [Shewanella sp. KX20019]|uniref:hypothetical protein n=1 Tax=Shewanella sp. KX20019 TaxID=2803864 RepID=UPI0019257A75|nr:hypothetical protein [Shewanella sp. KX20019]QQX78799.1 hypothetical protein JK628_14630 [Shewanella sp. KX20019]